MKYIAVFLKKVGNSVYRKVGQKKFKPTDETIRFEENTIKIPKNVDTFSDKKTSYLFIDLDNKTILNFIKNKMVIDPKMLDKFIAQDLIGKFMRAIKSSMDIKTKWEYMPYIITFILGAIIGALFATNPTMLGLT